MEVHHHSSPAPGGAHTSRKKWTHYFWEFLLLFLAVFCGFLAENQREHMIEHKREKQYIKSLLLDLKADINQLRISQDFRTQRIDLLDTLMKLLKSPRLKENTSAFYFHVLPSQFNRKFVSNNGTLSQLKNAGGLRLIRKSNVVDSILYVDVRTQATVDFENWERDRLNDLSVFDKVVDGAILEENTKYTYPDVAFEYNRPSGNPALLSYDKKDLERLYNRFNLQKRMHSVIISNLHGLKGNITRLIDLLEKEYPLK